MLLQRKRFPLPRKYPSGAFPTRPNRRCHKAGTPWSVCTFPKKRRTSCPALRVADTCRMSQPPWRLATRCCVCIASPCLPLNLAFRVSKPSFALACTSEGRTGLEVNCFLFRRRSSSAPAAKDYEGSCLFMKEIVLSSKSSRVRLAWLPERFWSSVVIVTCALS